VTVGSPARRSRRIVAVRIGAAFLVNGVTATVWLAATPALAARLGTTVGGFGVAFVALAIGGIAGTRAAPPVIRRLGSGPATVLAGFLLAGGLALRALPHALAWFVVAQLLAGLVDGMHDVAMNVEAVAVDARARMPIVNRLHAVWSLGAVAGGLLGTGLAAAGVSVPVLLLVAAAGVATVNLVTLPLVGSHAVPARSPRGRPAQKWWHSRVLVALAAMGVAGSVLEGAPLDWGALYLTDELHAASGVAAAATVTFTVGMVVSRLGGDHLVHRFGVPAVLRVGAMAAGAALVVALVTHHPAVVLGCWMVVGAGVAASYPALFVAAGRAPGLPPGAGIGAVSSVARTGFLIGPAAIGALASAHGLRWALSVPVIAALCIVVLADAARRPPA
jgi:MFS family permease